MNVDDVSVYVFIVCLSNDEKRTPLVTNLATRLRSGKPHKAMLGEAALSGNYHSVKRHDMTCVFAPSCLLAFSVLRAGLQTALRLFLHEKVAHVCLHVS